MANRAGGQFDGNFAGLRRAQFDLFDHERLSEFVANGGFDAGHDGPLVLKLWVRLKISPRACKTEADQLCRDQAARSAG